MRDRIVMVVNDIWPNSNIMWGFDSMVKNGYSVAVWRVGKLTIETSIWEKPKFNMNMVKLKSWKQFYGMLLRQNFDRTIFLFMGFTRKFDCAKVIIRVMNGKYCNIEYTSNVCGLYFKNYHFVKEKKYDFMDLFPASYNFLASELCKGRLNSKYEFNRSNNIILHTGNYDYFILNEESEKEIAEKEYILFMDQNLLNHKDQVNFGIEKWIKNRERYIADINAFLDYLEDYYQCEVIVALHPVKSNENSNIYKGKRLVYGDSILYTKYAKMVVVFSTSSIDFAVLYNKPILFYYCDDLRNSYLYYEFFLPKVKKLKGKALNISSMCDNERLSDYLASKEAYPQYLNYIRCDETKKMFFDYVIDYLKLLK